MPEPDCLLEEQGFQTGSCSTRTKGKPLTACKATLRSREGRLERLVRTVHLSRPENYLSVYQSGCNMSCRKCHSWEFSQVAEGDWMTPEDIAEEAAAYDRVVTLREPRERATAWHAHDTCRCCGSCVIDGRPSDHCPGLLRPEAVVYSPQGFGPARNIVAFTGGDITCRPEFYAECTRLIKDGRDLWVLIETNGYGLTPRTLDHYRDAGVDAFWLDLKAFDPEEHKWLTGCDNEHILKLPGEIIRRGFVLEVLSLHIPGLVEADELGDIAGLIAEVAPSIPFTILAFFPEFRMKEYRSPTVQEMVEAYRRVKKRGLENVRLGNLGVFARTRQDQEYLIENVDSDAF